MPRGASFLLLVLAWEASSRVVRVDAEAAVPLARLLELAAPRAAALQSSRAPQRPRQRPRQQPAVSAPPPVLPPTRLADLPAPLSRAAQAELAIPELNALQQSAVAAALAGRDVVVHAETGSGKTLCFALPLLARLTGVPREGLVLAPTLELAAQTARVFNALAPGSAAALERGAETLPNAPVVVGPPGMVLRLLERGAPNGSPPEERGAWLQRGVSPRKRKQARAEAPRPAKTRKGPDAPGLALHRLHALRFLVLDEADAMLMSLGRYATGKQKSVRERRPKEAAALLQKLCESRGPALQVLAASATVGRPLRRELAALSGRDLAVVRAPELVGSPAATPQGRAVGVAPAIALEVVTADADNRVAALQDVLGRADGDASALLFVAPGRSRDAEIGLLRKCDIDAVPLDEVLRAGEALPSLPRLLVSTPSSARGLDLPGLDLVVVWGVPSADSLVHMAGRTGRQGRAGRAVLLATPEEAAARLPPLAAQLSADFPRRHVAERVEPWARIWATHEKMIGAERKGI